MKFLVFSLLLVLLAGCASQAIEQSAQQAPNAPNATNANVTGTADQLENTSNFTLHVLYFYRDTCQYCARSTPVVNALRASYGYRNVVISYYELDHSLENRQLLDRLAAVYEIAPQNLGVPVVFIDGEYLMTFSRVNQYLENEIKACLEAKCPDPLDALTNASIAKPI